MFTVRSKHIRRIAFATRLFPNIRSAYKLDTSKLKSSDNFDGEIFCGGRSKNKDLLSYFGFIHDPQNAASSFVQLPIFRRSVRKLTNLVEQELEAIGAQELLIPTLVPRKLWDKSKRLERQKNALDQVFELRDNAGTDLLLGPTFEESITAMVAGKELVRESQLPLMLYQSSYKFRDEPNPRFGLLRNNEFLMNDLYTFDMDLDKAVRTYKYVTEAYERIFKRLSLNCVRVQSDPGGIGGRYSHEFQLPLSSGEDTIVQCSACNQASNLEKKRRQDAMECPNCGSTEVSHKTALELGHTFLLSDTYSKTLGAYYKSSADNSRKNFEMGCYGLGLTRILGAGIDLLSILPTDPDSVGPIQLRWPSEVEPFKLGIVTPAKRSKQYNAGSSEFLERFVNKILDSTRNIDMMIEDRDKEGIKGRLSKLMTLGVPHIITIGQRFLDTPPQMELLKLDSDKKLYEQYWLSEDQLYDYTEKLDSIDC